LRGFRIRPDAEPAWFILEDTSMGWLGRTDDKESLIRRLLKRRIAEDPNAKALGQTTAFADRIELFQLMGLPEATIVTCVETWATLARQGVGEDEIARRIAAHRGAPYPGGGIQNLIRALVQTEHANALYMPATHVEWCIREARGAYGV